MYSRNPNLSIIRRKQSYTPLRQQRSLQMTKTDAYSPTETSYQVMRTFVPWRRASDVSSAVYTAEVCVGTGNIIADDNAMIGATARSVMGSMLQYRRN